MESLNLTPANPATNPIFTAKFIFVKNKLIILLLLTALCHQVLFAQMPYTQKAYAVYVEKDIPYGTSPTYAGGTEALVLDLYKPIGDNNCQRPLLVMAHGGGFLAGTKDDYDVVQICQEMAARGYAAASIHYRLGIAYQTKGDKPRAITAFQQFLGYAPPGKSADDARQRIEMLKVGG